MVFNYEDWLQVARDRLETLYQQKAAIESEISHVLLSHLSLAGRACVAGR